MCIALFRVAAGKGILVESRGSGRFTFFIYGSDGASPSRVGRICTSDRPSLHCEYTRVSDENLRRSTARRALPA